MSAVHQPPAAAILDRVTTADGAQMGLQPQDRKFSAHRKFTTRVMVLGDSRGTTSMVTRAIEQAAQRGCSAVVSVGDFGIWPGDQGRWFPDEVTGSARDHGMPVVAVPGNHDDYDQLDAAPTTDDGWIVLSDWLLAAPRGHVWQMAGRPWMAFGGAASIDGPGGAFPQVRGPWLEGDLIWERDQFGQPRQRRTTCDADLGGWWPQERITGADGERAVAEAWRGRISVPVTHDVPSSRSLEEWKSGSHWELGERQRHLIQQVVDAIQPMITGSGHWHRFVHADRVLWRARGRGRNGRARGGCQRQRCPVGRHRVRQLHCSRASRSSAGPTVVRGGADHDVGRHTGNPEEQLMSAHEACQRAYCADARLTAQELMASCQASWWSS